MAVTDPLAAQPAASPARADLRVTVLGTGYLGTAHAVCLAELGFQVLGVDADPARVASLAAGELPFYETGLEDLLRSGLVSGRLRFSSSYREAASFGDVHFICVGTPQKAESPDSDLSQLWACIGELAPLLTRPCLVVGKSTVPVGTAQRCAEELARLAPAGAAVRLAWNPEFLREGHAVADTLLPDRIVIATSSAPDEAMLREIYATPLAAGVPLVVTDLATAELVKAAANAFLATKISFINGMAEVCEAAGADIRLLAEALGHDARISPASMRPGLGYGGGCLPKDTRALLARARELGAGDAIGFLRDIDLVNQRCRQRVVQLAVSMMGGSAAGRAVAVLGLAFKPDSDDIRDSPALEVAVTLAGLGARVRAFDPAAMPNAAAAYPELGYADSVLDAARDADVLLLLTDWEQFGELDPVIMGAAVRQPNVIDARHQFDAGHWQAAGWRYRALGLPRAGAGPFAEAGGPAAYPVTAAHSPVGGPAASAG
jgi:UDPglucose 6-dehydrogenase